MRSGSCVNSRPSFNKSEVMRRSSFTGCPGHHYANTTQPMRRHRTWEMLYFLCACRTLALDVHDSLSAQRRQSICQLLGTQNTPPPSSVHTHANTQGNKTTHPFTLQLLIYFPNNFLIFPSWRHAMLCPQMPGCFYASNPRRGL